jgi:hypothetical protein
MRIAAVLLLLLPAGQALGQEALEARLVVTQEGRETGREEFTLRPGRGRGAPLSRYPATIPLLKVAATLERTPEFALAKFQLDVEGPNGTTVILAAGSGARLIVRTVAKGSEAGRELPGGPDVVLLDESVYSLYTAVVDLATPSGKSLTGVFPRTGRRVSFVARRESAGSGAARVTLTGELTGTLATDSKGRLQRLELPGAGILVSREQD